MAAVSPAVVVPGLLRLGEEGYGVEAGIPTLVIAAASLDDVLAITGFSVMLGLTFAEGWYRCDLLYCCVGVSAVSSSSCFDFPLFFLPPLLVFPSSLSSVTS